MITTTTAPAPEANRYLSDDYYRDAWSHLDPWQLHQLRREYRHMRQLGVTRHLAKGVLYRTVLCVKGWDF